MQPGARTDGWRGWAEDLGLATALALFLALVGPYGSFLNGPLWQRLAFQLPCAWLAVGLIGGAVRLAASRLAGWRLWAAVAAAAAVAMLPVALLNMAMAGWLWPFLSRTMHFVDWYWEGLVIAEPASFGFAWLALRREGRLALQAEAARDASTAPPTAAGLLGAAPERVICLQMEDHYVRVHTAAGSRLVLATFGQAIEALAGAPGLRVHRSWWVADGAVERAERDGRNLRLALAGGLSAPVARTAVAAVRARGWV